MEVGHARREEALLSVQWFGQDFGKERVGMKWLLFGWALPVCLLGGWYGLSYYDINFGIFMLTRDAHDLVFQIYGKVLGIPPADIPPLVFRAIVVDSILVLAIFAFRRRAKIMAWWRGRQTAVQSSEPALAMDDNLSRAP